MSEQENSSLSAGKDGIERFGYQQELKKNSLSLVDIVLYGILFMVIIAPQSIFGEIQLASGGMTPLVYIVGFIAISFTAFSYKCMSNRFPIAGSVYAYVQRGINSHFGFIGGWLILLDYIFIPSLLYVLVANWGQALLPIIPWYSWIILFVVFNTIVNIRGMGMTKRVDWVMFVVEIIVVVIFIVVGLNFVINGGGFGYIALDPIYQPGKIDLAFIASAASIACLSFLGFDGMSTLAEEAVKPEKNIGKGIMIALLVIVGIFVLQTYVAALILPDWKNTSSSMGFFDAAELIGGELLRTALLIVNIFAVGVANIMAAQTATSRMLFGMGRDGVIPKIFGKVHPKFQTPYIGSIAVGGISLIIPLVLSMPQLVRLVNFGALSSFILLNFAVFWFFFVKGGNRKGFGNLMKYFICPWAGIVILIFIFTGFDYLTYVVGIIWLVTGIIIGAIKSKGYKKPLICSGN